MREFINGNDAITRAAIHSGCDFFAGYPITPATSILLHMTRELPKIGGVAIQGEDEIASIGFCIGAALTGKKVMTATSGPGISLYSENIGAAIMIEVPIVIIDVQRMGPATGGPTLGSYGDMQFVRWGTSGGYPIIALAPTDIADCYNLTRKAFNLAERFRCPVFVLTDKETSLTKASVDIDSFEEIPILERKFAPETEPYKPYAYQSPSQVQPFSPYGGPHIIRLTTSSHTDEGYLTKDKESIGAHNTHLVSKIKDHIDEISDIKFDNQPEAKTIIISYGITTQAAEEAVEICRSKGFKVSHLVVKSIWPVPEKRIREALQGFTTLIIPELNIGLYSREIERLTNHDQIIIRMNRIDGSLFSPIEIVDNVLTNE